MNERSPNLPPLAVDKSFAHGVKAEHLAALATKYTFLVPSAFYFEVFDGKPEKRPKTLTGFPEFRRVDIPTSLCHERNSGEPTRRVIPSPRLAVNADVLLPGWKLGPDESTAIQRYELEMLGPLIDFWKSVPAHGVVGFSADQLTAARGTPEAFEALCQTLRDPYRIRMIAAQMEFPYASSLDESWLQYRKLQVLLLNGLVMWRRYPDPGAVPSAERIEHDIHDMEYLTLGLFVGKLATAETSNNLGKASMSWRFGLLEPQGLLLTPDSLHDYL